MCVVSYGLVSFSHNPIPTTVLQKHFSKHQYPAHTYMLYYIVIWNLGRRTKLHYYIFEYRRSSDTHIKITKKIPSARANVLSLSFSECYVGPRNQKKKKQIEIKIIRFVKTIHRGVGCTKHERREMKSGKDLLDCREPVSQLPNQCVHTKQINKRFFVDKSSSWYCSGVCWRAIARSFRFVPFFFITRSISMTMTPYKSPKMVHLGRAHNYFGMHNARCVRLYLPGWSQNEFYNFLAVLRSFTEKRANVAVVHYLLVV